MRRRCVCKRPPKDDVEAAIREAGGNLTHAAGRLGCSRQTLYIRLSQYQLLRLAGVEPRAQKPAPALDEQAVAVSVKLPGGLWQWARKRAVDQDCSASAVVEALELLRALAEAPEE
jgi:hypothetical protein